MLSPGELKRGHVILIDGAPCIIERISMQTPSSRGVSTLWKVRARNLKLKQKVDVTFKSNDNIVEPDFERRDVQFLYSDPTSLHFMDLGDYNQFSFPREDLEEESKFLIDNMEGIRALVLEGEVIGIELPDVVELKIVDCPPTVKGDSATGRTKPATLETGLIVHVPEHIANGETIRVETATGRFLQRANK